MDVDELKRLASEYLETVRDDRQVEWYDTERSLSQRVLDKFITHLEARVVATHSDSEPTSRQTAPI